MPEPGRTYVLKERTEQERKELLTQMQELMNHKRVEGTDGVRGVSEDSSPQITVRLENSQQDTYRSATADSVSAKRTFDSMGCKYSKFKLIKESVHISTTPYRTTIDPTRLDQSVLKHQNAQAEQAMSPQFPSSSSNEKRLKPALQHSSS